MKTFVLPPGTDSAIGKIAELKFIEDFYLSGGTGLALQLGHRKSEDLDFFTKNWFDGEKLQAKLSEKGELLGVELARGTLNCYFGEVKLQFLHYPYRLVKPFEHWQGVQIASILDIGLIRLIA